MTDRLSKMTIAFFSKRSPRLAGSAISSAISSLFRSLVFLLRLWPPCSQACSGDATGCRERILFAFLNAGSSISIGQRVHDNISICISWISWSIYFRITGHFLGGWRSTVYRHFRHVWFRKFENSIDSSRSCSKTCGVEFPAGELAFLSVSSAWRHPLTSISFGV